MNWGYKILFVYAAFVAGIGLMVFKSSTQKFDLVTPDYYAKELKYQGRIDAEKRTAALSAPVSIDIANEQMTIVFPKEFAAKAITGTVLLYCPSDDKKDIEQPFNSLNGTFSFPLPASRHKAFEVQISWQADGVDYYFENKQQL